MYDPHTTPSSRVSPMQWLEREDTFRSLHAQVSAILRHRFPRIPLETLEDCIGESILLMQTKAPEHVVASESLSRAWLLKVAGRRIVREIVLQRRFITFSPSSQSAVDDIEAIVERPGSSHTDTARQYEGAIASEQWLAMLPAVIAEAVRMHVIEHYTVDEIARHQNNSRDTIKKRLKQGYNQLRKIIARDG